VEAFDREPGPSPAEGSPPEAGAEDPGVHRQFHSSKAHGTLLPGVAHGSRRQDLAVGDQAASHVIPAGGLLRVPSAA
jgi:hypothetical protein